MSEENDERYLVQDYRFADLWRVRDETGIYFELMGNFRWRFQTPAKARDAANRLREVYKEFAGV